VCKQIICIAKALSHGSNDFTRGYSLISFLI
jgi:hypothetical protein